MLASNTDTHIADVVRVRSRAVRSINVERDLGWAALAEGYVLTAQARGALARILDGTNEAAHTRAWTLTGPYGSGKSYFGLFAMDLVCAVLPGHEESLQLLTRVDPLLADRLVRFIQPATPRGLLPVPITGYRAPLQDVLRHGLDQALAGLGKDSEIAELLSTGWPNDANSRSIVGWLQQALRVVAKPQRGYSGILLILDEMGKTLEYTAAHADVTDVYLLQELAEFANRSGDTPFMFLGMLHQGFERYAGSLDITSQREWAKVQGRFEDVAYQEPPNQQMWLLANALEYTNPNILEEAAAALPEDEAGEAAHTGWCPPLMGDDEFKELCSRAYPLHPTTLVALPFLFRRLAQNERSIFAYLTALEPFGFQESIQQRPVSARIRLADLFDYLVANFQGRLYASLRARPLTEALERLQNAANLSPLAVDLLKTIGLVNWLAEISPLQATNVGLRFAVRAPGRSDTEIEEALQILQTRSLIVFRRFNQTYSIWQGSDVDVEGRLREAQQRVAGSFSLAQAVQQLLPAQPLVARRHSYLTGTLRYFDVRYVDIQTRDQAALTPNEGASGLVVLCVAASHAEAESFVRWTQSPLLVSRQDLVVCVIGRTARLHELLNDLRCLHWVQDHTAELRDDPVARRELGMRINLVETFVRNELDRTLSPGRLTEAEGSRWFYCGQPVSAERGIPHLLSGICDGAYHGTPRLWNELINRRMLSSQGAAARRNLIEGMLIHADEAELGITGYPPERSMYESILHQSGLHTPVGPAFWKFTDPPADDPLGLAPAWNAIAGFIFAAPPEPRSVEQLFGLLGAVPYGLTAGVAPVVLCAFLIVHRDETTLYQEGSLLPEPGIADWEVLLRRPELFAVAGCRVVGPRAAVVERLARGFRTSPASMPVVRELVRRLRALPEHAWRTQHLSARALAVRRAVESARSPERLLFHELPAAVELPPFPDDALVKAQLELFFDRLNSTLQELANVTPQLMARARDALLEASGLPAGEESWMRYIVLAREMAPTVTQANLALLLRRVGDSADPRAALDSGLAFVSDRPARGWSDADAERFMRQAAVLGKLFRGERSGTRPAPELSDTQRERSQQIARALRAYLRDHFQDDRTTLAVALETVAQELAANTAG